MSAMENQAGVHKKGISQLCHLGSAVFFLLTFAFANTSIGADRLPKARLSVKSLDLSRSPTTTELMAAGQLGGELYPTENVELPSSKGGRKARSAADKEKQRRIESINLSFGSAIQAWNKHEYPKAVKLFRKHLQDFPESPWAAEAALHIGCDATYNGRYTEADYLFTQLIESHKGKDHSGAKMLLNKARQRLALLKVEENNLEEALVLFRDLKQDSPDWRHRTYAAHWIQRLYGYTAAKQALVNCGADALAYTLEKKGRNEAAASVRTILPQEMRGHTLQSLVQIATGQGFELAAIQVALQDISRLPLPAILHIVPRHAGDKGHFWVLNKVQGDEVELFDPQSGRRFRQTATELGAEWTGKALVFVTGETLPGQRLELRELEESSGGCCGAPRPESDQGDPGDNGDDGEQNDECSEGSPRWKVNVVSMNLFVTDTPMWYDPPIGPPVSITLSYNSQSSIAQNEPFGNKWQFNYGSYLVVDTAGTVLLFMPDGRRDVFSPDGTGGYGRPYKVHNTLARLAENHFELRFPDDTVYVYRIPQGTGSQQPFLVEIRDAHGQKLTLGYDATVHLTTIMDALGRTTTLTYNADDLVTQVTDPFGRSAAFEYDEARNLTKITDMGGYWSSFTYDENVYLTSMGNKRGAWTFRIEPADGLPGNSDNYPPPGDTMWQNYRITVTNPVGNTSEYFYYGGCDPYFSGAGCAGYTWYVSPRDYVPWQSQGENTYRSQAPKTRYFFGTTRWVGSGEISQVWYPGGGHLFYEYDQDGNRTRITDSHGHTTVYSYNDAGRATSVTNPKGKVTTMTYADNGVDLLEITDNLGRITRTYNNAHQVKSITDRMGYKTTYAYNGYGQITSTTQAKDVLDTTTIFTYDADHQLKQVTRDSKTLQSLTHDPIGRIKTDTDATGLALTYDYNNLNNITKVTYPDGKFAGYTYSDWSPRLLDSETSRSGRTTSYFFDALERLTQLVNPGSGSVRNVYDANGNLIRFEDPNGNMTSFAYDLDNRLVKKTYADGKYISFTYDGGGLLQSRTDARGVVTTYSYDENDQLLTTTYSDSTPAVAHEYDEHGRIIVTQDGTGRYEYSYDANSRLASVDGPWPEDSVGYQYDGLGRVATLDPQKGQSISYSYDTLGRLTGIQRGAGAYSYTHSNSNPLAQGLTRPNGSTTTYQRDFLSRLTEISNRKSSADIINQFGYTYNQVDLRSSESVTNVSQAVASQNELITYQYNKVNQLLSSRCPDKTFSYDNDGNMIRGYTPEGYEFDASYDAENRLTSIQYTDSGGVIHRTEYYYSGDHFLRRMVEYQNAVKTSDIRLVRQDFLDLQERDENNNVIREYLWGLNAGGGVGGLLALKQGGQEYSYVYDGKGNVSALLDTAQGVVAAYVYDPFGNLMSQSGSFGQPFRFSTKRYDEKTGLSYYGFRFYSPELGRWITRDPQGETGGLNLYAFALNNPISFVDPTGEEGGYFCDILQDKGSGDVGLECHDGKWWVGWMETQGIKCFTFQPENFTLCVRKKGDPNPPGSKGFVKRCTGRAWNGIMNAFGGRSRERDRRYFQDTSSFCAQQRADNDDDRPCNSGAGAPHG